MTTKTFTQEKKNPKHTNVWEWEEHLRRSLSSFKCEIERQLHNEQTKRGTMDLNEY